MSDQPKPATGEKCPTCGYQLVTLDNDELAKLTEKAAYHELRQQLAAERTSKHDVMVKYEKQLAAQREQVQILTDALKEIANGNEASGDSLRRYAANELALAKVRK